MTPAASILHNIIPMRAAEPSREEIDRAWALVEEQNKREHDEYERQQWLKVCPLEYDRPLDYSKIKSSNHAQLKSIVAWQQFPRGVCIIGPTGMGKTRSIWAALRRHWQTGKTIKCKSSFQVSQDAVLSMRDAENAASIMRQYIGPDILFLDDIGKRLPPSALQFLFEVIERRTSNAKTLVGTSNLTMDALAEGVGDLTIADPIIRRIQEFCDVEVLK